MGLNIGVTGYFGSGSSAVLDLLAEYSCNGTGLKDAKGGYEHTTLYFPGGLFDLEDKLLLGNDIHRSDEALKTFRQEMLRLDKNNFGWYGSFREMFGNVFQNNLEQFLSELNFFDVNTRYYGQCEKVIFNPLKIPLQLAARILLGRTIYKWGRQFIYHPAKAKMTVAFPSDDEFYKAAQKFVAAYMNMFKEPDKENTIFDRILLCHNLYRLPRYFDDNFRMIVVNRDIRDVYILNKYIWKQIHAGSMYPDDLNTFVDYWKRIHAMEKKITDARILVINFEDLIYKYDETVAKIEQHCQLSSDKHIRKGEFFDPQKSIKNTQVFCLDKAWETELEVIERELQEYKYDFPYEIVTSVREMFNDSRVEKKKGLLNFFRK